jgi:TetR/AcrR family transcriptional repressor of uid operon
MQQRSQETQERILRAAQLVFARGGYDATSVAEICRQAGVSKGALYHHFPTKQSVFLALLEEWLTELDAGIEALRQEALDMPQALLQMASLTRHIFNAADGRLTMFLEFWSQASLDPTVWQATIAPYRRYQRFFASLVREGIEAGSMRDVDPDVAAHLIVSVAVGLLLQGLLDPEGEKWDQLPKQVVQLMLEGLIRK